MAAKKTARKTTKKTAKRAPKAPRIAAAPAVEPKKVTYYKVLSATGESIHGGSLKWSLPDGDKPGDWHEVTGEIQKCSTGLHLTTEPARWWKEGARCFEVEAEGIVGEPDNDRKVVARKVRLVREIVLGALAALNVFVAGQHEARAGVAIASGSATVTAYDSATVTAYDSATVTAYDSATVTAYGSATVRAYDSATVTAYGSATVTASGSATVTAEMHSTVISHHGAAAVYLAGCACWIDHRVRTAPPVVKLAEAA